MHKHYLARLLVWAFLIVGIGFWMTKFVTVDAASRTVWSITRDNNDYLSASFWDNSPTTGDIIKALYGSGSDTGTVYTENRNGYTSWSCLNGGLMNVVYTGNLSLTTLAEYTIYVLTWPVSVWSDTITMADCSAIISNNSTGTTFYSTVQLTTGMLYASGNQYMIFDNLAIDGSGWASPHTANQNGIYLNYSHYSSLNNIQTYGNDNGVYMVGSSYNSLDNIQAYDNDNAGIYLEHSSDNNLSNIQSHNNNYYGINLYYSSNNTINGSQVYNNRYDDGGDYYWYWITLDSSSHDMINNTQIYNNYTYWIQRNNNSEYNTINNTQIYNNTVWIDGSFWSNNTINNVQAYNNEYGILFGVSQNTVLNKFYAYNNDYGIWIDSWSTGTTYYGTLYLFWNNTNPIWGTITNLTWWTWTYSPLWRTTWSLNTWMTMSWDYITNPLNTSGDYMVIWSWAFTGIIWQQAAYLSTITSGYSYGDSILTQAQPVYYSWTDLVTGWVYVATKFIGSNVTKINGGLSISGWAYTNTSGVTIILTGSNTPGYRFFGDIITEKSWSSFTTLLTTWLTLSGTDWRKNILWQIRTNGNRATHYTDSIILDTTTPTFTWTLTSWSTIISGSGWYYNTTWVTITFSDTNLSWAILSGLNGNSYLNTWFVSGTTITTGWTYLFTVYDYAGNSTGMIFTIDTMNPLLTWTYPTTGLLITGNNTISFTWTGTESNLSGYDIYIYSGLTIYATWATTWATSYSGFITNGSGYSRYVIATDKAGNTWTFASGAIPFTVNVPLSGIVTLSWATIVSSWSNKWTKTTFPVFIYPNKPCSYSITGDYITTQTGDYTGTTGTTITVSPTWADGQKILYVYLYTWSETKFTTLTGYLDITKPSDPTLSSPASGYVTTWTLTLSWSAATETGIWLSGYRWYISPDTAFATITLSGFTTSTTASPNTALLGVTTWTFYRKIRSLDRLGRTGESTYRDFYYSGTDYTPTSFTFDSVTNARLNKVYLSSEETIAGMTPGIYSLVEITKWSLYINGDEVIGQTGLVHNGDTVQIELISSDEYETRVSSTMTIWNFSTYFRVTTKAETNSTNNDTITTNLSNTQKLQIAWVFLALKDLYSDSTTRTTFFNALLSTLQDIIDESDDDDTIDALQYLYDVIENYLWDDVSETIVNNGDRHVAPNGRVYRVTYNSTAKTYTSPDFMFPKTFTTLAAMTSYIDVNNGGRWYWPTTSSLWRNNATVDSTRQSAPYVAPNGKSYRLFKTTDGRYSSYNFISAKYFISVDTLKNYIYQQNR